MKDFSQKTGHLGYVNETLRWSLILQNQKLLDLRIAGKNFAASLKLVNQIPKLVQEEFLQNQLSQ